MIKFTRRPLSRRKFEELFKVEFKWYDLGNSKIKIGGKFKTDVRDGWKWVNDGETMLRAKTWRELAIGLELI